MNEKVINLGTINNLYNFNITLTKVILLSCIFSIALLLYKKYTELVIKKERKVRLYDVIEFTVLLFISFLIGVLYIV